MLRRKQHFIRGCYQRSPGVVFIRIMPSISWATIGWWWLTRTRSTHVSIQPSQYQQRPRWTFWSRILPISVTHVLWWWIMPLHSCRMTFKTTVNQETLFIWQVPHITPLQRNRGEVGPNLQAVSVSQTKHQAMRFSSSWYNTYGKWIFTARTPDQSSNSHEVRSSTPLSRSPCPREAGTDYHQGAVKRSVALGNLLLWSRRSVLCVVLWATPQSPASTGSGHRNEKAWNTKCQRSGIAMVTCLETSLRPRYATEDGTFPGDDPNDRQSYYITYIVIQAKKIDVDFRGDSLATNKRICGKHYLWFL